MRLEDFQRLLELRGSDLERWPPADRDEAKKLLAGFEEARRVYQETRGLDEALRAQPLGMDEQESVRRLRAALRKQLNTLPNPEIFALRHTIIRWAQVGAMIVIAALAAAVGWSISDDADPRGGRTDVASVLMRDSLEEP